MTTRRARPEDMPTVLAMMRALTGEEYDFDDEIVFVAERGDGAPAGFISLSLRAWAEGCDSTPVPYVEGWWVEAENRRRGLGRALMVAAENWCRENGYSELGSDADLTNNGSLRAHAALGFEPAARVQFFSKRL